MPTVLGIDSSTQSISAVLLDTDQGRIVAEESVQFGRDLPNYGQPHGFIPGGTDGEVHSDPCLWLDALELLLDRMRAGGCDFGAVEAVSGSGQQHGSVYGDRELGRALGSLRAEGTLCEQLAPNFTRATVPIWMDSSTTRECAEITAAVGGPAELCRRSGSIAIERFTGPQIRKFAKEDPEAWARTGVVHLVSSFLASVWAGRSGPIDWGDGAGMNLMNLAEGVWDAGLVAATAPDLGEKLPPLVASSTVLGPVAVFFIEKYGFAPSCQVVAFSGDNPCSLVGMGAARPGRVVISLGTSDTLFAAMPEARTDPEGFGHVFGNPMGGFMSLICFKNGSLARERVKEEFALSWEAFGPQALAATPYGNEGRVMLPFYEPELTPRLDLGGARYVGWGGEGPRDAASTVRAVLEAQFTNMRQHSRWLGVEPETILLTGGASQNDGIAQVVADVFGAPVSRLAVTGSAGLGAAMQAAVAGCGVPLTVLEDAFCKPVAGSTVTPGAGAREAYAEFAQLYARTLQDAR